MSPISHLCVTLAVAALTCNLPAQVDPVESEVGVRSAKILSAVEKTESELQGQPKNDALERLDPGHQDPGHQDPGHQDPEKVAHPMPHPATGPFGPDPNSWFSATKLDLGSFLEGETAVGKFPFRNPHDETHRLSNLSPNCQCAKASVNVGDRKYVVENQPVPQTIYRLEGEGDSITRTKVKHIAVAAGEEGCVEIYLDLKGVKGQKEAFISMRTTDKDLPMSTVSVRAVGVTLLKVIPPDVNLNKMAWSEQREFSFEVTSEVKNDFEVTKVEPTVDALKIVSQEKQMRNGRAVWHFTGTYGPDVDARAGGGVIKVHTDIKPKVGQQEGLVADVRVIAVITGPMTVRPGTFLPFGRIKQAEGASKVIEFEANDNFNLEFKEVTFENVSIDTKWLAYEATKDGNLLKLEIKILPGAPARLIRGDVKIGLNHPAVPEKLLQFNGFVR